MKMKLTIDINDNTYNKIAKMSNGNIQKFVETLVEQFSVLEYIEYEWNKEDYIDDLNEECEIEDIEDYEDFLLKNNDWINEEELNEEELSEEELREQYFFDLNCRMYTPDELRLGE